MTSLRESSLSRYAFLILGIAFATLLAARPIPGDLDLNDTGRYVSYFLAYCEGSLDIAGLSIYEISYLTFYGAVSHACMTGSSFHFLLGVSLLLPASIALCSNWTKGSFYWAAGLVFSIYGIDLMTNAMRQLLAVALLFASLRVAPKHPMISMSLTLVAGLSHISALLFAPFLFWAAHVTRARSALTLLAFIAIATIAMIALGYLDSAFLHAAERFELMNFYSKIYEQQLSVAFNSFIVAPMLAIFALRWKFARESLSRVEVWLIIYATFLFGACLFFFPAIAYRTVLVALPLQLFLAAQSPGQRPWLGPAVLAGFQLQLVVLALASNYFEYFFSA